MGFVPVIFFFEGSDLAITTTDSSTKVAEDKPVRRSRRRKTAHLKMVPSTKELRESLRVRCREIADTLSRDVPPSKDDLEAICRKLLIDEGQPEGFLGWIMVVLSSCFWEEQIQSIPHSRRLFLLPHCLKPVSYTHLTLPTICSV